MNQEAFTKSGEPRWRAFEELLAELDRPSGRGAPSFPRDYRAICHDLAIARQRQFDAHLVDRLNTMALCGHQHIYEPPRGSWRRFLLFAVRGFPAAVRAEAPIVLLAALLFYGPALALTGLIQIHPDLAYSVLDTETAAEIEAMYNPSSAHHLRPRADETDVAMFGFYIQNNVSIGLRTFATGVFFGLGSLFTLLFNALFLGAVAGHLLQVGFSTPFTSFVVGHSALELQAVVLSAAAGLRLGWPLVAPGPWSRKDALKRSALQAVPLVYGSVALFLIAAVIEAFWSANTLVPPTVKYGVGAGLWGCVLLYFLFAGRRHAA